MMEAPINYSPNKLEELVVLKLGLVKVSSMAGLCIHPSNSLRVPRKVSSLLISTIIFLIFKLHKLGVHGVQLCCAWQLEMPSAPQL